MKLQELKELLITDCIDFGMEETKIEAIFSIVVFEKISSGGDNILSFYYDEDGYSLVYWERGNPINGISAKTPDDFRFAFQNYNQSNYNFPIDKRKPGRERVKQKDEFFMSMMTTKFGHTDAYRAKLEACKKIWGEFNIF